MEWPDDALTSVASKKLSSFELNLGETVEAKLKHFFQYIHQSIERASVDFYNSMKRRFVTSIAASIDKVLLLKFFTYYFTIKNPKNRNIPLSSMISSLLQVLCNANLIFGIIDNIQSSFD
jgi:small-conductance mechanosensitive channel